MLLIDLAHVNLGEWIYILLNPCIASVAATIKTDLPVLPIMGKGTVNIVLPMLCIIAMITLPCEIQCFHLSPDTSGPN